MNSSRVQFENQGQTYDVSFRRLETDGYECEVRLVKDGRVDFEDSGLVSSGYSHRNPMDRPNNETGRKLAFSRAISIFPVNVRSKAWKAYFNRNDGAALRKHKYNMKSFV
jgi:hypothetical protein